ncbi:MAG: DPP IV N-terminal domain-containing protein [Armatimonadota bacterium]
MKRAFVLCLLCLSVVHRGAGPEPSLSEGQAQLVTFSSARDGNREIYVMNEDGSNQVRLTNSPTEDIISLYSPDGTKIVFHSHRVGNGEVHVMDADGSNVVNLTNNPNYDSHPRWTPDGRRILFTSDRDGNYELYWMNADGSQQTRLTNNPGQDWMPAISPDGTKIVWASDRTGNRDLYIMDADGTNVRRLTDLPGADSHPFFSRDGKKVYFDSYMSGPPASGDLWVINVDGTGLTRLTDDRPVDAFVTVSPDNTQLAFASDISGDREVYVMNRDGTGRRRLTFSPGDDAYPNYAPADLLPHHVSVPVGALLHGELDDIFRADDSKLMASLGSSLGEDLPVQIVLRAISPVPTASEIRINLETQASSPTLLQVVSLWNFGAGRWEDVDTRLATQQESRIEVSVTTNPNRFIESGTSNVRVRVAYVEFSPAGLYPWYVEIDMATLRITR